MAPLIVREILRIVASLREIGVSILLVEQNARAALETADYGYVLETGEITHQGPAGGACQRCARGRDLSRRVDLMARAPYDDIVLAAPVTIPYARYSIRGAHWFLGRALAATARRRKAAEGGHRRPCGRELHAGARHARSASPSISG